MQDVTAHAALAVSDVARARAFYQGSLGLDVISDNPDGTSFAVGDSWFFIYPSAFAGTNQATAMALVAGDFDATVDELIGRGIVFEQYDLPGIATDERGVAEADGEKAAWFKDPDGNIIAVDQRQ